MTRGTNESTLRVDAETRLPETDMEATAGKSFAYVHSAPLLKSQSYSLSCNVWASQQEVIDQNNTASGKTWMTVIIIQATTIPHCSIGCFIPGIMLSSFTTQFPQ